MKKLLREIIHRQEGVAMLVVLAFMALSVPIVTSTLYLSGTLSIDSRVKNEILKGQYAAQGCTQHASYRLFSEAGYADGLAIGVPDIYNFDGCTITVIVGPHQGFAPRRQLVFR